MKTARLIVWTLTAMCGGLCLHRDHIARSWRASKRDTAVLVWSALECSQYAMLAGKTAQETERLFGLGYENGKRFVQAVATRR